MKTDNENRITSIDIIKGIAILLVVYAHTAPFCRNFLYTFTLQIFLITSGYCFKNRISDFASWKHYMAGKLRSLYVPCAVCNGIYALLEGLFLRIGLYTDDPAFISMTKNWPVPQRIYSAHTVTDILRKFARVILLTDTTQMGTATWFLILLLVICAVHGAISCLIIRLNPILGRIILISIFILMSALGQYVRLNIPGWDFVRCSFFGYAVFLIGIIIKELNLGFLENPFLGLASFLSLAWFSRFYFMELANARIDNVAIFMLGSLGGWCMLKPLADIIANMPHLSSIFRYIGKRTIPIICLHILLFKAVTWLYILTHDLPRIYLASFHVYFDTSELYKLLYLAVGAGGSLLIAGLWNRLPWFKGRFPATSSFLIS